MFQLLATPPLSYLLGLVIGVVIGGGVQLIYGGFLLFSLVRKFHMHIRLYSFSGIIAFLLGITFTIIGIIFFLQLCFDVFEAQAQSIALSVSLLVAVLALLAMVSPLLLAFYRKRKGRR